MGSNTPLHDDIDRLPARRHAEVLVDKMLDDLLLDLLLVAQTRNRPANRTNGSREGQLGDLLMSLWE